MSSAILCGKRSSFFEDSSPPVSKRIRCSSSSLSPPPNSSPNLLFSASLNRSALDHLVAFFPDMDRQLLEKALKECGDDIEAAIRSLNELRLGGTAENMGSGSGKPDGIQEAELQFPTQVVNDNGPSNMEEPGVKNLSFDSAEWVEIFVQEMTSATSIDDAKARASRALEMFEKSISARVASEASQRFQQENILLKQQLEATIQENSILKRAVSIQHERQKEFEEKGQELHSLKQLLAQYQEQLRALEVSNYTLAMHLKQAQQGNSISGRFHPDVF